LFKHLRPGYICSGREAPQRNNGSHPAFSLWCFVTFVVNKIYAKKGRNPAVAKSSRFAPGRVALGLDAAMGKTSLNFPQPSPII
jgi:hypothetical protein